MAQQTGIEWCDARTGKKANGRELDGRVWDEFPSGVAVLA